MNPGAADIIVNGRVGERGMYSWKICKNSIPTLASANQAGWELILIPTIILLYIIVALFLSKRAQKWRVLTQSIFLLIIGFIFLHCLCLTKSILWGAKDLFNSKFLSGMANLWFPLITIGFVLFFGRHFYCDWICPIGFLQDLTGKVNLHRKKVVSLVWLLILLVLIGLVGWVYRPAPIILSAGAWLGLLLIIISICMLLYPAGRRIFCKCKYIVLIGWAALAITAYKISGPWCVVGQANVKYSSIISLAAILLVSAVFPRAWCQYICPDGGLLQLLHKRLKGEKRREIGEEESSKELSSYLVQGPPINPQDAYHPERRLRL